MTKSLSFKVLLPSPYSGGMSLYNRERSIPDRFLYARMA
jgi:hypothetical protein